MLLLTVAEGGEAAAPSLPFPSLSLPPLPTLLPFPRLYRLLEPAPPLLLSLLMLCCMGNGPQSPALLLLLAPSASPMSSAGKTPAGCSTDEAGREGRAANACSRTQVFF